MHMAADPAYATPADAHYAERARAMDRDYEKAFAALPTPTREALARRGITGPECIAHESRQGEKDVSDFVDLAAPPPKFTERQKLATELLERFSIPPAELPALVLYLESVIDTEADFRRAHTIARLAGRLIDEKNVAVSIMGLAFAAEFRQLNISNTASMRAAAKKLGCSPAYISQYANMWCDELGLPRSPKMKSAAARKSYQKARLEPDGHWRNQLIKMCACKKRLATVFLTEIAAGVMQKTALCTACAKERKP